MPSYTLLIDETGIDGSSPKVIFVGCLVESSELSSIGKSIEGFNERMLQHPRTSGSKSWVNGQTEVRHFCEDHFTLRELFVAQVVEKVPARVYAVLMDYDQADVDRIKVVLMHELMRLVRSTRRVKGLAVIAEQSTREFQKLFPDVVFETKNYLPLSIVDYYAASIKDAHDLLAVINQHKAPQADISSSKLQFYRTLSKQIAFEFDISTNEKSSRGNRLFLRKLEMFYNTR